MSVINPRKPRRKPRAKKRKPAGVPTPGVKRGGKYPADPTLNWTGANADRYARRFVFSPAQLDNHWKRNYSKEGRRRYVEEALYFHDKSARILEVGCNVGNQLVLLKSLGFTNVQGVEVFAPAVAAARRRGLIVTEGDARNLPFEDGSFDVAMTCWCLCHIGPDDWQAALKELFRVARIVFISEPAAQFVPMPGKPDMKLSDKDWTQPGYLWCRDIYTMLRSDSSLNVTYIQWCGLPGRVSTQMIVAGRRDVPDE